MRRRVDFGGIDAFSLIDSQGFEIGGNVPLMRLLFEGEHAK